MADADVVDMEVAEAETCLHSGAGAEMGYAERGKQRLDDKLVQQEEEEGVLYASVKVAELDYQEEG